MIIVVVERDGSTRLSPILWSTYILIFFILELGLYYMYNAIFGFLCDVKSTTQS